MDSNQRIERALLDTVSSMGGPGIPPQLAAALRYAVFPGGARVRPRLSLAVARACGDSCPRLADAAAASIELLHCASLVHDDLPCFDDADTRRGKPSVHKAFGEPVAVLVGDALIIGAFQTLARNAGEAPERLGAAAHGHFQRRWGAVRHRCRPGVGVRAERTALGVPPGQDWIAVCRGNRCWRAGCRSRARSVAEAWAVPWRGVPGRGRYLRHDRRSRGAGQARQAGPGACKAKCRARAWA